MGVQMLLERSDLGAGHVGDAQIPDLAGGPQKLEGRSDLPWFQERVSPVEQERIDVVRFQPRQAAPYTLNDRGAIQVIVRHFTTAVGESAMRIDLDAFPETPRTGKDFPKDGFGLSKSIGFRLVEDRDSRFQGGLDGGFCLVDLGQPVRCR
jgi:hypothetical protein